MQECIRWNEFFPGGMGSNLVSKDLLRCQHRLEGRKGREKKKKTFGTCSIECIQKPRTPSSARLIISGQARDHLNKEAPKTLYNILTTITTTTKNKKIRQINNEDWKELQSQGKEVRPASCQACYEPEINGSARKSRRRKNSGRRRRGNEYNFCFLTSTVFCALTFSLVSTDLKLNTGYFVSKKLYSSDF